MFIYTSASLWRGPKPLEAKKELRDGTSQDRRMKPESIECLLIQEWCVQAFNGICYYVCTYDMQDWLASSVSNAQWTCDDG